MTWNAGDRVTVRGARWRIVRTTTFSDCEALHLTHEQSSSARTLLLPFDRPRPTSPPRVQVVSRRRWAREVTSLLHTIHPYGALRFCTSSIRLLPYQLEPALAIFRHGIPRILLADDVGLGKTVEAGVVVREVARRSHLSRILIITPAAIREQWQQELTSLFDLSAIDADAAWLRRSGRELPPDVNPWSLPGVYLASMDFIKRPEALKPLEDLRWDLLVVDEAHAATPGSDRLTALHSLSLRSHLIVLVSATPHSGDEEQFRALCGIGADRGETPIVVFRRSREEVMERAAVWRSLLLAVRPSVDEMVMHRLLDQYTSRLWRESRARGDSGGELVAIVLRKRALSSPFSLGVSLRRRLTLLDETPALPLQQLLPLLEEDDGRIEEDLPPETVLGRGALADARDERQLLTAIVRVSGMAALNETKLRALLRYLRRIREPVIVFTEYRDTAEHLAAALSTAGHRVCLLHGGLAPQERASVTAAFRAGGLILVATDAASEGLNLHHRCRVVVHFELPWAPSRLRQRRGRVDRLGQTRRVHEIVLIANDTCEQLVLVPLLERAARSRSVAAPTIGCSWSESRAAALVLGDISVPQEDPPPAVDSYLIRTLDLREEARQEVLRLATLRELVCRSNSRHAGYVRTAILPLTRTTKRCGGTDTTLTVVLEIAVRDEQGQAFDRHAVVVAIQLAGWRAPEKNARLCDQARTLLARAERALAPVVESLAAARIASVAPVRRAACRSMAAREARVRQQWSSAARELVQAGLFDRRALRSAAVRQRHLDAALEDEEIGDRSANPEATISSTWEVHALAIGDLR